MKTNLAKTQTVVLLLAGAVLILVAGFILLAPAAFYAANGILPTGHSSLLNELKAPAGLLLCAGLFMTGSIFQRRLADTATSLAALIYLSYAFTRGLSMAVDGIPASGLVQAAVLEAVIGLACLVVVIQRGQAARRNA